MTVHARVSLFALVALLISQTGAAQDIRVYTQVLDVSKSGAPETLSHSVTYFHLDRVYDYMPDVGEVVIFEPVHNRFIILKNDYTATEVSFAEVNHFLESAEVETVKYIRELAVSPDPAASGTAALLNFQLKPEFQEEFLEEKNALLLKGKYLQYRVAGTKVESPNIVRQYLEYADWAKRLNYVLHPHPTLPTARLKLNESLRTHQLLPTEVEMTILLQPEVKLKAVHQYSDKLQSIDRQSITRWEKMLNEPGRLKWLTFPEYQQNLLAEVKR